MGRRSESSQILDSVVEEEDIQPTEIVRAQRSNESVLEVIKEVKGEREVGWSGKRSGRTDNKNLKISVEQVDSKTPPKA